MSLQRSGPGVARALSSTTDLAEGYGDNHAAAAAAGTDMGNSNGSSNSRSKESKERSQTNRHRCVPSLPAREPTTPPVAGRLKPTGCTTPSAAASMAPSQAVIHPPHDPTPTLARQSPTLA